MTCSCCSGSDPCPTCGDCSQTWVEGVDEYGDAFADWSLNVDEDGFSCSGPTVLVYVSEAIGYLEYLVNAGGARCFCVIANRQGNYNGEVISGKCTSSAGECGCCYSIWDGSAWSTDTNDNSCADNDGGILSHGGGFVVRLTCTCPEPVGSGSEVGERVQVNCVQSYYCDPPNPDCTDP